MAYTKEHLAQIEQAIIDLGRGERVVEVRFGPGDSTRYAITGMEELKRLRDQIRAELAAATKGLRIRGYRLNHSRGL